jgi:hypothetical protein
VQARKDRRLRPVVTGENAQIIIDIRQHNGEPRHRGLTHFNMKIAYLEDRKAVKCFWNTQRNYVMPSQFDLRRILTPASV